MTRSLRSFLSERSLVEFAVAVALAGLVVAVISNVAELVVLALPRNGDVGFYSVRIGRHVLGFSSLSFSVLALALLLGLIWLVVRALGLESWEDDDPRECPHCLSEIPTAASVCEYCTRDVAPAA